MILQLKPGDEKWPVYIRTDGHPSISEFMYWVIRDGEVFAVWKMHYKTKLDENAVPSKSEDDLTKCVLDGSLLLILPDEDDYALPC